ncbi:MAG TPA: ribonuclease P protein component, partial [Opitutaceae bacterium]|nr:ribonuclease P protein component [Opitutaceae bacterium]
RVDCSAFTVWWTPRAGGAALPRACFVAATQAVGGAVLRNRAKRRMREIFRRNQGLLPPSCDLLLVARQSVNRWPFARLESAFAEASARMRSGSAPAKP